MTVTNKMGTTSKLGTTLAGVLLASAAVPYASALEVTAGDYEAPPPGLNFAVLYLQAAQRSDFYVDRNKVSSNFKLRTSIGLARYIHVARLGENAVFEPQVILPFGRLATGGDAAFLGDASGVADLIVGAPVKFVLDPASRDTFSVGPYLYLPTGSYDSARGPMNLGENRWKALLQLAYIRHFNAGWALDLVGDVTVNGKNTDFGLAHATRKQDPRYEAQAHVRYTLSPGTVLSAGYGVISGAESQVGGIAQHDRTRTEYARLTAAHFIDQSTQIQVQLGKDLSVANGFRENSRFNLRLLKIF